MAADSSIFCKVALCIGHNKVMRHFAVDKDVFLSFRKLENKLKKLFCQLSHKSFSLEWKDNEGDLILISNDDDLKYAINIFGSKCYLYVKVFKEQVDNTRIGDECTRCDESIFDFKYKCLDCPKFIMCSHCRIQGAHKDHFMIRFPYSFIGNEDINRQIEKDFKDIVKEYRVILHQYITAEISDDESQTTSEDEVEEIRAPPQEKIATDHKPQKAKDDLMTFADENKRESSLSKVENVMSLNCEEDRIAKNTTTELGREWECIEGKNKLNALSGTRKEKLMKEEYHLNIPLTQRSSALLFSNLQKNPTNKLNEGFVKELIERKKALNEKLKANCAISSEATTSSNSSFEVLGTESSYCGSAAVDALSLLKKDPLVFNKPQDKETGVDTFCSVVISPVQRRRVTIPPENCNVLSFSTVPATTQTDFQISSVPEEANEDCNEDNSNSSGFFKTLFNI